MSIQAQQNNKMEKIKKSGHAPVNGIEMYYELYDHEGIPLVLIHGGGSTIETSFGKILPLLSASNKIIAVELQAHGRTSDRNAPESFEQDADDVAALLRHLKVAKANFFGFSNGGSTAMQIAMRHPDIVNKIVVASGAYKRDGFIDGFFDTMNNATLDNMPESLKAAFLKLTPDKNKLQTMFEKDRDRMKTFKDWPEDKLQSIKAPALFLSSAHDVILPEHTISMARLIQGAQFAILPGSHGAFIGASESGEIEKGSKKIEMTVGLVDEFLKGK